MANSIPVIASPSLYVILTLTLSLTKGKGKNLTGLRVNSVWQSHSAPHLRFFGRFAPSE